jgi:pullulanase/glycogen debranching enzyme
MALNLIAGDPSIMGATPLAGGVNFALYSHHGVRVELVIYDPSGTTELARQDLPARSGDIWHGFAPKLTAGHAYGYRVHGPFQPEAGHVFNPNKLMLDPYAKGMAGTFIWDPSHFAHVMERQNPAGPMDTRDNAAFMQKGVIMDPARLSHMPRKPPTLWRDTLICELHAKGFTIRASPRRIGARLPALAATHRLIISRRWASQHLSFCPFTPSSTTSFWSIKGWSIIGAITRSIISAPMGPMQGSTPALTCAPL